MNIPVHKITPKDISDTPEGFDKRYAKRHQPEADHKGKLPPIRGTSMRELMDRVGIDDNR